MVITFARRADRDLYRWILKPHGSNILPDWNVTNFRGFLLATYSRKKNYSMTKEEKSNFSYCTISAANRNQCDIKPFFLKINTIYCRLCKNHINTCKAATFSRNFTIVCCSNRSYKKKMILQPINLMTRLSWWLLVCQDDSCVMSH